MRNGRRYSVSASVMNLTTLEMEKKRKVVVKSDEERANIKECIDKNALFNRLDEDSLNTIVDAFEKLVVNSGTNIINQGDVEADHFYLVQDGSAEAVRDGKIVKRYGHSDGFGELALLYNQARGATVRATSDLTLWSLDRGIFKKTIVLGEIEKRERRRSFLLKCELLEELSEVEAMTLSDALTTIQFDAGDVIIEQGQPGNNFFIVESGKVDCVKDGNVVASLEAGSYFGEIALMFDKPRQATVVAMEYSVVLSLDRKTFQRLLGPLSAILKRNMDKYNLHFLKILEESTV